VFAIQDEIAHAITSALRVKLSTRDEKSLAKRGTTNLEAYDLFPAGTAHDARRPARIARCAPRTAGGGRARPGFARAHATLALTCIFLAHFFPRQADLMAPAREAAEKAIALDPTLPEAQTARAHLLDIMGRTEEAEQGFKAALELNPDLYETHYFYGRLFFVQRNWHK
jgi:adenylate cyclase